MGDTLSICAVSRDRREEKYLLDVEKVFEGACKFKKRRRQSRRLCTGCKQATRKTEKKMEKKMEKKH